MTRRLAVAVVVCLLAALTPAVVPLAAAEPGEGTTAVTTQDQARISTGDLHSCAVLDTGEVQCWGANDNGQLGNGTITASTVPRKVAGITTALSVSAGGTHTCALLYGGGVDCWGNDGSGQDGNNATSPPAPPVLSPVPVVGLSDATAVAAGGFHTCALRAGGSVVCWGHDGSGQLGDGDGGAGTSLSPVTVLHDDDADPATPAVPLTGVTAIASGEYHSCALIGGTGAVECWGHNGFGQLGDGSKTDRPTAVAVSNIPEPDPDPTKPPHKALAVTAGQSHTCAVLDNGTARCWGSGFFGQLGNDKNNKDDSFDISTTPVTVTYDDDPNPLAEDIKTLTGITAISAGQFHTCARMSDGRAQCWGANGRGQLGNGDDKDSKLAVAVSGLTGARAVTAGGFHTCALVSGNAMKCWGYDFYGQLGAYAAQRTKPDSVTALKAATTVATGDGTACALVTTADTPPRAKPYCWGDNSDGQLGAGLDPAAVANSTIPVPVADNPAAGVAPIDDTAALTAGNRYACALPVGSQTPQCWGRNAQGQLGDGSTTSRSLPVPVSTVTTATQVSAGGELDPVTSTEVGTTCAVLADAGVRCWGAGAYGQLGDGSSPHDSSTPVTVVSDHDNDHDRTDSGHPTAPVTLTGATKVVVGGRHACALMSDTTVRCWGRNADGQLGDGTTDDRTFAVVVDTDPAPPDEANDENHVVPLTGVVDLAAGARHTCAVTGDDKVWCWGRNSDGQLGDGTTNPSAVPVQVSGTPSSFVDMVDITAGDFHTCVRVKSVAPHNNTTAACWGDNSSGQLGVPGGDSPTAVAPTNLGEPGTSDAHDIELVKALSGGRNDTCAALVDTSVSCWGDNGSGQLGDGIGPRSTLPLDVQHLASVGGNVVPAPANDAAMASPGSPVVIPVLANDTDPDGDALTVASVESPTGRGTATTDGSAVTYTPNLDFCTADPTSNTDTFTYAVTDGTATVPSAIAVTVTCPNTAPVANADSATTPEDTVVTIAVLANDTDVNADPISVAAIGSTPAIVGTPVATAGGSAVLNADGTITYSPAPDSNGAQTFTYTATDGSAPSAPATVTVSVTPVNDPPVAADDATSTLEDTSVLVNVVGNDHDIDGPTIAVSAVADPPHGSASVTSATEVTYTPDINFNGVDTFTYTLSDGSLTSTATVTVTVTAQNDGPIAANDSATTTEDTPVDVFVLANDTDVDGNTLSIASVGPVPAHGTAAVDGDHITYTPAPDFCGVDSFGYTVTDGSLTAAATVVPVGVRCVNDPPAAHDDAFLATEDTPASIEVLANDTDPDGDSLSLVSVTDPPHGTASVASTGVANYAPDPNFCSSGSPAAVDTFGYTVSDNHGGSSTGTVTVMVTCVNDPPSIAAIGAQSTEWGYRLTVPLVGSDPDGDALTYSVVSGPGAVEADGAGGYRFAWTPSASDIGSRNVTVRASDGGGLSGDRTFTVAVTKRATTVAYTGSASVQVSDPAALAAHVADSAGLPVGGVSLSFSIGSRSSSAATSSGGDASASLVPDGPPRATTVEASFAGNAAYLPSSASAPFTVLPERITVTFTGTHLTVASGASAAVTLSASVAEEADGSLGGALGGVTVTFTDLSGTALCSAGVSPSSPGQGTASCTTGALALGSRALVVKAASASYAGLVDVGAFTVAQVPSGAAAGAGRAGGDDFAFRAVPAKKGAPAGDAVHVRRSGGSALVEVAGSLTSMSRTCSTGKVRSCSATIVTAPAARWSVNLSDGTVSSVGGAPAVQVSATDNAEPSGAGADTYGVNIASPDAYSLAPAMLSAGNIRIP